MTQAEVHAHVQQRLRSTLTGAQASVKGAVTQVEESTRRLTHLLDVRRNGNGIKLAPAKE